MLLEELKDFQARDIFNMQVIQKLPFIDSGDGTVTVPVIDLPDDGIGYGLPTSEPADGEDEEDTRVVYSVDPVMYPGDEENGVLVNGEYIINPTAQDIYDYVKEDSNRLGKLNGEFMYVITLDEKIIIGNRNRKENARMPHPTLIGGADPKVLAAGMVRIDGGKIKWVNNASGHFKPGNECLEIVEEVFSRLPAKVFAKDFKGFLSYEE